MGSQYLDYPITNAYTFAAVFSNPDNARPLLEAVLGVPIGEIRNVESEHVVEPSIHGRGVRMDVFVEDGTGTVYDVEMQNENEQDLALRSRYLLSSFDRNRIMRGQPFSLLGRSVVIFVCKFDPIGFGDRVYVVRPAVEGRWVPYEDGTLRVFLNAQGAAKDASEARSQSKESARLAAFLAYADSGDTMGDEWVRHIDEEVRALNADEGWRNTVLGIELDFQQARHQSREEGKAEGRAKGLEEGRAEGREEGRAEGREEGRAEGIAETNRILTRLADALTRAGRIDELPQAIADEEFRSRLLVELGIA